MPHPNPKGRHAPHRRKAPHAPAHHTPLFHQPFRGGRTTKDPGAPLLSAVCVSPSPWHSPGSGAAKTRKTPRLPARDGKTTCRKRKAEGAHTRSTEPNTQQNRAARTRRDKVSSKVESSVSPKLFFEDNVPKRSEVRVQAEAGAGS